LTPRLAANDARRDGVRLRGPDYLAVAEQLGVLTQAVEIGRATLSSDAQLPGGGFKGLLDARIVPVGDHDVQPTTGHRAEEDGRDELMAPREAVADHEDSRTRGRAQR